MAPTFEPLCANESETCDCLRDLFTRLANGHLEKDIDALMPWAQLRPAKALQ
jgi:hypothetical protein